MKLFKKFALIAVMSLGMLTAMTAKAAIVFPALDIQNFGTDTGLNVTATTLDIDATVFAIILDDNNLPSSKLNISEVEFILTATGTSSTTVEVTPIGTLEIIEGTYSGSFTIGTLLSGTFDNLTIGGLADQPNIEADLVYTAGSLQGSLTGGRLELAGAGFNVAGKLGQVVVPVPAAVWLFGSGLLGLVAVARRRA